MIHVGNDIVDLSSPFAIGKGSDNRFIKRVLTPREIEFVYQSGREADYYLWLHWAAKESAYKAVSKIQPDISSSPKKFEVSFEASSQTPVLAGVVNTPVITVSFSVYGGNEFIHCVGSCRQDKSGLDLVHGMARIDHLFPFHFSHSSENESTHVRKMAQNKLSLCLDLSPEEITFGKSNSLFGHSYPTVYLKGEKTTIDISFSHDGRYVGYAFYVSKIRNV